MARSQRHPNTLSRRALNRALLARQMLLERVRRPAGDALEHLVGLQAQAPDAPYFGLWSRLHEFDPSELAALVESRGAVRIALMRSTIHLVTRHDCLRLRPATQPMLERGFQSAYGRFLTGIDRERVVAEARKILAERPLVSSELGRRLAQRWRARNPSALAYAARAWLPQVQPPPRGVWGKSGPPVHVAADGWIGDSIPRTAGPDDMVLRYLGAFGPATVADTQQWSGLSRLAEVLERLRPRLVTFRDERGRELFDLPDAPRPDPDTPAPVRFVAPFDNLVLSHDDRTRVMSDEYRRWVSTLNGMIPGTVLVDGFVRATWSLRRQHRGAVVEVKPFGSLPRRVRADIAAEGDALLRFAVPEGQPRAYREFAPV